MSFLSLNETSVAAEPLKLMGGDVAYSSTVLEEEFEGMVVGAFWHIGVCRSSIRIYSAVSGAMDMQR